MTDFLKKYFHRHFDLHNIFSAAPSPLTPQNLEFNSFEVSKGKKIWLKVVSVMHLVCLLGLAMSVLLVDVLGIQLAAWSFPFTKQQFAPLEILKMISVSGLIGYGTNYIAIQMLFRPVDKRPIWGQGLVPSQRDRIIFTLSRGMHTHILSQELILHNLAQADFPRKIAQLLLKGGAGLIKDEELVNDFKDWFVEGISRYIQNPDNNAQIKALINEKIDKNLQQGLEKFLLSTYKTYKATHYDKLIDKMVGELPHVSEQMIDKVTAEKEDELAAYILSQEQALADFIAHLISELLHKLDIAALLRKQMAHFDDRKLERMVRDATNEQLLYIQYLGTVLGILGGFFLWKPLLMFIVYGVILAGLWLIDELLFRQKNRS